MTYTISSDKSVTYKNKCIGTVNGGYLLQLNDEFSIQEWNAVEKIVEKDNIFYGKLRRETTGFHHSYHIFDGMPYRASHSLQPPRENNAQDYKARGYIGSGGYSNVKMVTDRHGYRYVVKITGVSFSRSDQISDEARILNQYGIFTKEYVRSTTSKKIWRNASAVLKKRVMLTALQPGIESFMLLDNHLKGYASLDLREQYTFAILLLKSAAQIFYAGFLHRDIKPENFIIDLPSLSGGLCDFGFAIEQNSDRRAFSRSRFGSPGYISPSAFHSRNIDGEGFYQYDESSELYGCGVILYFLFSDYPEIQQHISEHFCPGFTGDLNDVPDFRYQQAVTHTFKQALQFFKEKLSMLMAKKYDKDIDISNLGPNSCYKISTLNYLHDFPAAIRWAKSGFEQAINECVKAKAFDQYLFCCLRHAEFLTIRPAYQQGLEAAIEWLKTLENNIKKYYLIEKITEVTYQYAFTCINNDLRKYQRALGIHQAKYNIKNRLYKAAAKAYLHAAEHCDDWCEQLDFKTKAVKLMNGSEASVKLKAVLIEAWQNMADRFITDNDDVAAKQCLEQKALLDNASAKHTINSQPKALLPWFSQQSSSISDVQQIGRFSVQSLKFR